MSTLFKRNAGMPDAHVLRMYKECMRLISGKKIGMLAFMKKITILIKKRVHKKQKDVNIVLDSSCNLLC